MVPVKIPRIVAWIAAVVAMAIVVLLEGPRVLAKTQLSVARIVRGVAGTVYAVLLPVMLAGKVLATVRMIA